MCACSVRWCLAFNFWTQDILLIYSSKSKTERVFRCDALVKHVRAAVTLNGRILFMNSTRILLMLIREYVIRLTASDLVGARILAALWPHAWLVLVAQGRASVCHLRLIASFVAQIEAIRIPHLLTNFAVGPVDIIVNQLRFWHLAFVVLAYLLSNLWGAGRNRLLQTTSTLAMTHLLALMWYAFRSGQLIGLTQVIPPRLLLHDEELALLITVHLRRIGHPDLVEGRSLAGQLALDLLIHGRIDRGAKIFWRIQFIFVYVNCQVECFHDRRWNILNFA